MVDYHNKKVFLCHLCSFKEDYNQGVRRGREFFVLLYIKSNLVCKKSVVKKLPFMYARRIES